MREQRGLIDALTAETMTLREEAVALQVRQSFPHGLTLVYSPDSSCTDKSCFFISGSSQAGLQQQTAELEQNLNTVVLVMGGLGLLEAHIDPPQDPDVKPAGLYSVCMCVCVPVCAWIFVYCIICFHVS